MNPNRAQLIRMFAKKWVNGTVLRFYLFDTKEGQKDVVRRAFETWKSLGIGLEFKEVESRDVGSGSNPVTGLGPTWGGISSIPVSGRTSGL